MCVYIYIFIYKAENSTEKHRMMLMSVLPLPEAIICSKFNSVTDSLPHPGIVSIYHMPSEGFYAGILPIMIFLSHQFSIDN